MSDYYELPLDIVADVITSDVTEVTEFETEKEFYDHIAELDEEGLQEMENELDELRDQFRDDADDLLEQFDELINEAEQFRHMAEEKHDKSSCCLKGILVIAEERKQRNEQ